jgi:hypothetical protein
MTELSQQEIGVFDRYGLSGSDRSMARQGHLQALTLLFPG